MVKPAKRPNRCSVCGILVREENKSRLCTKHYRLKTKRERYQKTKVSELNYTICETG